MSNYDSHAYAAPVLGTFGCDGREVENVTLTYPCLPVCSLESTSSNNNERLAGRVLAYWEKDTSLEASKPLIVHKDKFCDY